MFFAGCWGTGKKQFTLVQQELGLNSDVAVVFNVEERKAVITGTW